MKNQSNLKLRNNGLFEKPFKSLIIALSFLTIVGSIAGCGSSSNSSGVELTYGTRETMMGTTLNYILFTAKADQVTISSVKVNRGNCEIYDNVNRTLSFGQQFDAAIRCEPSEVEVETDLGSSTFTF